MLNKKEYSICQKRKHQPAGKDGEWNICKFCGTQYKYVSKIVEK